MVKAKRTVKELPKAIDAIVAKSRNKLEDARSDSSFTHKIWVQITHISLYTF